MEPAENLLDFGNKDKFVLFGSQDPAAKAIPSLSALQRIIVASRDGNLMGLVTQSDIVRILYQSFNDGVILLVNILTHLTLRVCMQYV